MAGLPTPSKYNPKKNYKKTLDRRNWVLEKMYQNRYIDFEQKNASKKTEIIIKSSSGLDDASAPYFAEEVRRALLNKFGFKKLYEGGLSVRTTLDPHLQKIAEDALTKGLEKLDKSKSGEWLYKFLAFLQCIKKQLKVKRLAKR